MNSSNVSDARAGTWLINFSQTGVPLASGALGAALGMLPVFWVMGAALLAAGWFATREVKRRAARAGGAK